MISSTEIRDAYRNITAVIPYIHPATAWYFAKSRPEGSIMPDQDDWSCMFSHLPQLFTGAAICFSSDNTGCSGASCYLGFSAPAEDAGYFLAEKERFKKSEELGKAFYEELNIPTAPEMYVVWQQLESVPDECQIEVINLWIQADGLSGLVTLANYDRPSNDNVLIPCSSGCQSLWTLPYLEKEAVERKCFAGCMDPVVRHYLAKDVLSFSMVAERFMEMANNVAGSFLEQQKWLAVKNK